MNHWVARPYQGNVPLIWSVEAEIDIYMVDRMPHHSWCRAKKELSVFEATSGLVVENFKFSKQEACFHSTSHQYHCSWLHVTDNADPVCLLWKNLQSRRVKSKGNWLKWLGGCSSGSIAGRPVIGRSGWNPWLRRLHVEVSLIKIQNPKWLLRSRLAPCMAASAIMPCMNLCVSVTSVISSDQLVDWKSTIEMHVHLPLENAWKQGRDW